MAEVRFPPGEMTPQEGMHQCCCTVMGNGGKVRCQQMVPRDVPFCDACEGRHPGWPASIEVTQEL